MLVIFKKLAHFLPCDHCRREKKELQKEVIFWKDLALKFKKPHQI